MREREDWLTKAEFEPGVFEREIKDFNRDFAVPLVVQCQAFLIRGFFRLPPELYKDVLSDENHFLHVVLAGLKNLEKTWSDFVKIEPPKIEDFSFRLPGEEEVWDEEKLWRLVEGIMGLINTDNWLPKNQDPPFFILLPKAFPELPREVRLGNNQTLKRLFDRVFAPQPGTCSEEKVATIFDHLALLFDEEGFVDQGMKRGLLEMMMKKGMDLDVGQRHRVLDVGCGTGLAHEFKPERWSLVGVDLSAEMCKKARDKGMEVYHESAGRLHFPDEFFDGALGCFVANWFIDEKPFHEISRVLKPGGVFFFNLFKPAEGYRAIYHQILHEAGFEDIVIIELSFRGEKKYRLPLIKARKG